MIELNKDNFDATIAHGVVLVDFWSESCERCKELMPEIHQLAEAYRGQVTFCSLNIQGNRRLAMAQKVMGLPSVVIWRNGERVHHLSGESLDSEQIRQALETLLHGTA
ncbi:thioredoxin family protein [Mixta tenebrionis]|uniref:Thioredoxin n=1 Tax=Mixta tenebrionis TaxID=2562439 RepID=A0A506VAV4_9GAMM|nr:MULTISPECIES: thioredoxin family protein [Mixta]QHM75028.1 Thioredoxin [Mixta theicola]TPW42668.1 thioredoxin family protein [Mixta tenebrionis]